MKQFKLVDNILGWLSFLIAAIVYCSTIEPTASFWDCPEFITTGYKLEIGHPADSQSVLAVYKRSHTGSQDGQHDECAAFGDVYFVPILEYHTPHAEVAYQRLE